MKDFDEVKLYLIGKYLNKEFTMFDLTVKSVNSKKFEHFNLDDVLFRSIEKSLKVYEPLSLLGMSKESEELLSEYNRLLNTWKSNENYNEKKTDEFIKEYDIDTQEIDGIVLELVSDSFIKIM